MEPAPTTEPSIPTARRVATGSNHPLGPLWQVAPLDTAVGGRLYSAGLLAAIVALFVVAARLHPSGIDHGAHQYRRYGTK